jgi:hypothetical protein
LVLLVFSAHHAAPGAPLWRGSQSHVHHQISSELSLSTAHDHALHHCELCHASAFQLPLTLAGVPRAPLSGLEVATREVAFARVADLRLPVAHAPPCLG